MFKYDDFLRKLQKAIFSLCCYLKSSYVEIRILHDFEDRNRFGLGLYYVTTNYLIAPVCIVCTM